MRLFDALLWRLRLVRREKYEHLDRCYHDVWRWWENALRKLGELP